MSLTCLPRDIWRDVLKRWLGDLQDVVRVDRSCSFSSSCFALQSADTNEAFELLADSDSIRAQLLEKLCSWIQTKNVYIGHIQLIQNSNIIPPQWQTLIAWSGEACKILELSQSNHYFVTEVSWASRHLRRLERLKIEGFNDVNSRLVARLLHNNASTLTTLCSNGSVGELRFLRNSAIQYYQLKTLSVAHWDERSLVTLLKCCPNLITLSVYHVVRNGDPSLSRVFIESCSKLQRLQINYGYLQQYTRMEIAEGFPVLQQLFLYRYSRASTAGFADFVCALPQLHTLSTHDVLPEAILIEIANRGHQSLRVIDACTKFTYNGLRQITAGLPQLTGLAIYHGSSESQPWKDDVLEYCGLQHLRTSAYVEPYSVVVALMNSSAIYCPGLRTLSFRPIIPQLGNTALHNVVSNCTQLHIEKSVVGLPQCPGLVVTEQYAPLTEWISDLLVDWVHV